MATCTSGFINAASSTAGFRTGPVFGIIDARDPSVTTTGINWFPWPVMDHRPTWTAERIGQVFGIASDNSGNIYLSATAIYVTGLLGNDGRYSGPYDFGPAGSGGIYRISNVSAGTVTNYITTVPYNASGIIGGNSIPNGDALPVQTINATKPGLGNICFDPVHNRLFVSNFENGTIYRVNVSGPIGVIDHAYDPSGIASGGGGVTANPGMGPDGGTLGIAPLGERVFGLGYDRVTNRLYYSVWVEDRGTGHHFANQANVIRSVALTGAGGVPDPLTDQFEIRLPDWGGGQNDYSMPVSDIEFSTAGEMLVAEKGVYPSSGVWYYNAHTARVISYRKVLGVWTPTIFNVGRYTSWNPLTTLNSNAAGGVDYSYRGMDAKGEMTACDSVVWMSGDYLVNDPALAGSGGAPNIVYGLQRSSSTGNTQANYAANGYFIDLNEFGGTGDKNQIGDVDAVRNPCNGIAVPPCDGLRISLVQDTITYGAEGCCTGFSITYNPPTGATYNFTGFSVSVITPGVVLTHSAAPSGWTTGTGTWNAPATGIPAGTTSGFTLCLDIGTASPPQIVEFTFIGEDGQVCTKRVETLCVPPEPGPPCGSLRQLSIACTKTGTSGSVYGMQFQLHNESGFTVATADVVQVTPMGVSVTPTHLTFGSGIPNNGTSSLQTLTISGPAAVPGASVCITLEIFNASKQFCCMFDTCIVLPKCADCCELTQIRISGTQTHNGLGISTVNSTVTVLPATKKIIRATATVISAHVRRVGTCGATNWLPTYGDIVSPQALLGGTLPYDAIVPPYSSGPPPGFREASWGTVPAGVTLSGAPLGLKISFPAPPPPIKGCRDTLRYCVRYSFTDDKCVTCDTTICYQQVRTGSLVHTNCPPFCTNTPIDIVVISLATKNTGKITLTLPPLSPDLTSEEEVRIVGLRLQPDIGVNLVTLGGVAARDNAAQIPTSILQGESKTFDVVYDNVADRRSFGNTITMRYIVARNPRDTLDAEQRVIARVPGYNGGDSVAEERVLPRPQPVRTFMLQFVNANVGNDSIARITLRPLGAERILAFGPPADRSLVDLEARAATDSSSMLVVAGSTASMAPVAPGQTVRPLYLTVTGTSGDSVAIEYVTYNPEGIEISRGRIVFYTPLTVAVPDDEDGRTGAVTGASMDLRPIVPNPSTGDCAIHLWFSRQETVELTVSDAVGRVVDRLLTASPMAAGDHVLIYSGGHLASGAYYVTLRTGSGSRTQTMQIVR